MVGKPLGVSVPWFPHVSNKDTSAQYSSRVMRMRARHPPFTHSLSEHHSAQELDQALRAEIKKTLFSVTHGTPKAASKSCLFPVEFLLGQKYFPDE